MGKVNNKPKVQTHAAGGTNKAKNNNKANGAGKKNDNLFTNNTKKADGAKKTNTNQGANKATKQANKAVENKNVKSAVAVGNTVTITKKNGSQVVKTYDNNGKVTEKTVTTKADKKTGTPAKTTTTNYTTNKKGETVPTSKTTKQGNKTSKTKYKDGKKAKTTTTEGDKKTVTNYSTKTGNKTDKTITEGDKKTTITYNPKKPNERTGKTVTQGSKEAGTLIETKVEYKDGKPTIKTVEAPNTKTTVNYKDGVRTDKTITNNDGSGEVKYEYQQYGDKSLATSKIISKPGEDGKMAATRTEEYKRHEDGSIETKTVTEGTKTTTSNYTYDKHSNTRTVAIHSEDAATGIKRDYTEAQELNEDGKVVKAERKDETGAVVRTTENTYDKETGSLTGSKIVKTNAGGISTTIERTNYVRKDDGSVTYDETVTKTKQKEDGTVETVQEAVTTSHTKLPDGTIVDNKDAKAAEGDEKADGDGADVPDDGTGEGDGKIEGDARDAGADAAGEDDGVPGEDPEAAGFLNGTVTAEGYDITDESVKSSIDTIISNAAVKTVDAIKAAWEKLCNSLSIIDNDRIQGEEYINGKFEIPEEGGGDITDDGIKA